MIHNEPYSAARHAGERANCLTDFPVVGHSWGPSALVFQDHTEECLQPQGKGVASILEDNDIGNKKRIRG